MEATDVRVVHQEEVVIEKTDLKEGKEVTEVTEVTEEIEEIDVEVIDVEVIEDVVASHHQTLIESFQRTQREPRKS